MVGLAADDPEMRALFGQVRGPEPLVDGEPASERSIVPKWLERELSPLVGRDEWPALVERAPLDLRANLARTTREAMLAAFPGSEPTPLSPWGLRLPADTRVDDRPEFLEGLVEVQDEGSQLIALACEPKDGLRILDLCAGAGGKSLALAAAAPGARSSPPTPTAPGCRSSAPAPPVPARRSTRGCSIPAASSTSSPTCAARPMWCWSMRLARAAAPGGATRNRAGG